MARKLFCAMFVMMVGVTFVLADDFRCNITKVDGSKITIQKYKKSEVKGKKGEKDGDPMTFTVDDKATIAKGVGKKGGKVEAGDKIEKGLKDEAFSKEKLGDDGAAALITTEGEGDKAKVTQILLIQPKKKAAAQ
jgi:hypothetical protein